MFKLLRGGKRENHVIVSTMKTSPSSEGSKHSGHIGRIMINQIPDSPPGSQKFDYVMSELETAIDTDPDADDEASEEDINDTVIINVGGIRHEICRKILLRVPGSRLASLETMVNHFRRKSNEYYFDRHPGVFSSILNFYRTGELHLPNDVCNFLLKNELEYWEIDEELIEDCCFMRYNAHWDQMNTLAQFENKHRAKRRSRKKDTNFCGTCYARWQPKIWTFLDDPYSSKASQVFAWLSLSFVLISIFTFCAETHPYFMKSSTLEEYAAEKGIAWGDLLRDLGYDYVEDKSQPPLDVPPDDSAFTSSSGENARAATHAPHSPADKTRSRRDSNSQNSLEDSSVADSTVMQSENRISNPTRIPETTILPSEALEKNNSDAAFAFNYILTEPDPVIAIVDYVCYFFFTTELVLRLVFCNDRKIFFQSFLNIVDVMAILPFYIELLVNAIYGQAKHKKSILDVLLFTRIIRIFRVFRLIRHHRGLQILVFTIRASLKEILLLLLFLGIGMVIFSSLIYYADHASGNYKSIPHSFWWAVITMTTVGYGDVTPSTPWGYAIGSCCAVSGVLVIAFTVPVIVNNFLLIYQYVQFKRSNSESGGIGMNDPDKWSRENRAKKKKTSRVKVNMAEHTNGTKSGWQSPTNTSEVTPDV